MIDLQELAQVISGEIKHAIEPLKNKIKALEEENSSLKDVISGFKKYDDSGLKKSISDIEKKLEAPVDYEKLAEIIAKDLPAPESAQYKGVYSETTDYIKGDSVTYSGSLWIAKSDNPAGVPSNGQTEWQLAVKRGARGKSFIEAAREIGFKGTEQDLMRFLLKGDKPNLSVTL